MALDNRMRMSGSVAEATAIDSSAQGPRTTDKGRCLILVNDHGHRHHYDHRSHLQRQTQQEGRVALAGVPSVVASKTRLHRSLVRWCADRSQMGNHRRSLHSQVSPRRVSRNFTIVVDLVLIFQNFDIFLKELFF